MQRKSAFKSSRKLAGLGGKGNQRTGRGARWPAVSRQRVNPATGRDRAAGQSPVGLTFRYKAVRPMPPTMKVGFALGPPL